MVPPLSRGVLPTDASTQFDCAQYNCAQSHSPGPDRACYSLAPPGVRGRARSAPCPGEVGLVRGECVRFGNGRRTGRRRLTRIPTDATQREKWRLALDRLDTLAGWGMRPPTVVADAAYGTNAPLRA